jgi:hypothetical protein
MLFLDFQIVQTVACQIKENPFSPYFLSTSCPYEAIKEQIDIRRDNKNQAKAPEDCIPHLRCEITVKKEMNHRFLPPSAVNTFN